MIKIQKQRKHIFEGNFRFAGKNHYYFSASNTRVSKCYLKKKITPPVFKKSWESEDGQTPPRQYPLKCSSAGQTGSTVGQQGDEYFWVIQQERDHATH